MEQKNEPTLFTTERELISSHKPLTIPIDVELPQKPYSQVMINAASTKRVPISDRPAFRIVGFGSSDLEILSFSRSSPIDYMILRTHEPFVLSTNTSPTESDVHGGLSASRAAQKAQVEKQGLHVSERASAARTISDINRINNIKAMGGDVEEEVPGDPEYAMPPEVPPPEEKTERNATSVVNKDGMTEFETIQTPPEQNFAVISVVDPAGKTPVVIFYAAFDTSTKAEAYAANIAAPLAESDVHVITIGKWYACDIFGVSVPQMTQYMDSGLNELMKIPQRNSKLADRYRPIIEKMEEVKAAEDAEELGLEEAKE